MQTEKLAQNYDIHKWLRVSLIKYQRLIDLPLQLKLSYHITVFLLFEKIILKNYKRYCYEKLTVINDIANKPISSPIFTARMLHVLDASKRPTLLIFPT